MILVALKGGVGNQLFQYAAGRSLAFHLNTSLALDISWYKKRTSTEVTPRNIDIFRFNIPGNLLEIKNPIFSKSIRSLLAVRSLIPYNRYKFLSFCERKEFLFDPLFHLLPKNVFLCGYWQSYKYFEDIDFILSKELQISSSLSSFDNYTLGNIKKKIPLVFTFVVVTM